jgi:hypothetical protein
MSIKFDPITLKKWKKENIVQVFCHLVSGGCAGTKINISPFNILRHLTENECIFATIEGIAIFALNTEKKIFDTAYISFANNKWICVSESVNTRCGCGKSISLKTGNPLQDKAMKLRSLLKKGVIHN